jgi:hypothetical protein
MVCFQQLLSKARHSKQSWGFLPAVEPWPQPLDLEQTTFLISVYAGAVAS